MALLEYEKKQAEQNKLNAKPQDYPEDFDSPDTNGFYMGICEKCGLEFMGHKYRVIMKVCKLCWGK
jgi:hypothetical protein